MSDVIAADVSDKAILAATRQIRGANDSIQLKYTMPSGRVISSAPFKSDQGAKALIEWCNVIRGQYEADYQDQRDKARQEWMERKAREAREASGLIDPSGRALTAEPTLPFIAPSSGLGTQSPTRTAQDALITPDTFLSAQLAASREAVERLEWQAQEVMQALVTARANLQKWEGLAAALAPQASPAPVAPQAAPKKRGRPKKIKTYKDLASDLDEGMETSNESE